MQQYIKVKYTYELLNYEKILKIKRTNNTKCACVYNLIEENWRKINKNC